MREIKFRGKSVDGKWIYGSLLQTKTLSFICKAMSKVKTRNYLIEKQETIGEYTGLKDKNGVEIYENMIINNKYIVIYNFCKFALKNIKNGNITDFKKDGVYEITREYFEQ